MIEKEKRYERVRSWLAQGKDPDVSDYVEIGDVNDRLDAAFIVPLLAWTDGNLPLALEQIKTSRLGVIPGSAGYGSLQAMYLAMQKPEAQ